MSGHPTEAPKTYVVGTSLAAFAFIDDDGSIRGPILLCAGHAAYSADNRSRDKGWNQTKAPVDVRAVVRADVVEAVNKLRAAGMDLIACASCAHHRQQRKVIKYELLRPLTMADLSKPIDGEPVTG